MDNLFARLPGALLPWYAENKRELPWREDKNPYHIWLSEIMLQQTRVGAVRGYYARFLQTLPNIEALANADDELLHKLWEGLGYYSRVRNLKKAAMVILESHGGQFPKTHKEVMALPGIGPYTAGAICSIAFSLPTPAVDGNVLRVIARLTDDDTPADTPQFRKDTEKNLVEIYPENAGDFTQALMELGATVCGPNRKPDCENCPCKAFCKGSYRAEKLPIRLPKRQRRTEEKTVFILECEGKLALHKRPDSGLLAGLWQFPDTPGKLNEQQAIGWAEAQGFGVTGIFRLVERRHIFTHITWEMTGAYLQVSNCHPSYRWLSREELETQAALPTAYRQFLEEA